MAKPPFVQYHAPAAWSTLSLTIHADGRCVGQLVGRQPLPAALGLRPRRRSSPAKSGLVDFKDWYRHAFGEYSPWGGEDSPALVTAVESAMERRAVDR